MILESDLQAALADEFGEAVAYRWAGTSAKDAVIASDVEARAGLGLAVLVPASTETRWFQRYCSPWEVRFLRGPRAAAGLRPLLASVGPRPS